MYFDVAQRFAALIAGVRQTSLKLSAKASAGLPRSVRGYAGLQRGIASQCQGVCRFAARDCFAGSRSMQLSVAGLPRSVRGYAGLWRGIASQGQGDTDLWRGMVSERGVVSCYVPSAARSFAFGELAHIEALVFCVRAYGRVKEICFRGTGAHQGACVLRPSSARVEHPGSAAGLPRSVRGYAGL